MLRVEDLDAPRTRPEAVDGNLAELRWLGLDWDEGPDVGGPHAPYRQSARTAGYRAALAALEASGHVRESFLSRREVAAVAPEPTSADLADGAARGAFFGAFFGANGGVDDAGEGPAALEQAQPGPAADGADGLSDAPDAPGATGTTSATSATGTTGAGAGPFGPEHWRREAEIAPERRAAGRTPALRFTTRAHSVRFVDELRGPVELSVRGEIGDFIVRRADGQFAYQLAVVVDDAAMAITEVVRGTDLLGSTGAQLLLLEALGLEEPNYAHVGRLLDPQGEKLSKRHGALSLHELEATGVGPERVVGLLAHTLGWLPEPRQVAADELIERLRADSPWTADAVSDRALTEAELAWLFA